MNIIKSQECSKSFEIACLKENNNLPKTLIVLKNLQIFTKYQEHYATFQISHILENIKKKP